VPIDAGDWLDVAINIGTIVCAIAIAHWQHRHAERRARSADLADLRRLLAEGESLCAHVRRYGPLAEQQLIRLGARDFVARAERSALCGPERLRTTLAGLATAADELARSATFASELRCAVVQDRTVQALTEAIDRAWIEATALRSR
jgi:hypothetical protein